MKKFVLIVILITSTLVAASSGKELFKKCAGCHGLQAQKKALGISKIIQGWDANKTANVLKGYKDGTYGGPMKGIMKGQTSSLTVENISDLSKYISTLK